MLESCMQLAIEGSMLSSGSSRNLLTHAPLSHGFPKVHPGFDAGAESFKRLRPGDGMIVQK